MEQVNSSTLVGMPAADLKNKKPVRKPRSWNGKKGSPSTENSQSSGAPRQLSFMLTMSSDTKPEALPELEKIFLKHGGNHRVYLKIVSPKNWETILSTDRHITPSEEMMAEVDKLLGKEKPVLS